MNKVIAGTFDVMRWLIITSVVVTAWMYFR